MSKYTTELRFICETYAGNQESQDYNKIDEVIAKSRNKIFDFDFPIFDEDYRSVLETKIIRHYYTREIGAETVGLWKHFLNVKMNEIMPYYNKLYESELLEFNPLYNVKYDTNYSGSASGTNEDIDNGKTSETNNGTMRENIDDTRNVNADHTSDTMEKYSDTPQGGLDNVRNGTYLTSARQTEVEGNDNTDEDYSRDRNVNTQSTSNGTYNSTKNGKFNNTDQYLRHVEGNNGSRTFSELIKEYRETFINIDMMIINELNDLFMGVW